MSQEMEIVEQRSLVDASVVEAVTRSEIESLVDTARKYARSVQTAINAMITLACQDEESATDCIYSLPRDGKTIIGPSIRFAEMVSVSWGNNRVAARTTVIDRAEKFVEAEGFFLDAQTNVAQLARIRRRIVDRRGRLYSDDMILTTCNAAQSIARRNAILAGVPKMAWRPAYQRALQVLRGTADTLAARRRAALEAFAGYNLSPDQVFEIMGVKGVEDIDIDRVVHLRGLYSSIANGDVTVEELLRAVEPEKPTRVTASTAAQVAPTVFEAADDLPSVDAPAEAAPPPAMPEPSRRTTRVKVPAKAVAAAPPFVKRIKVPVALRRP